MSVLFAFFSIILSFGAQMDQTEQPVFDVSEWNDELKNYYESENTDIDSFYSITGPLSVANIENHRGKLANILARQQSIPCLLYTSPSPRDLSTSRMPSSA